MKRKKFNNWKIKTRLITFSTVIVLYACFALLVAITSMQKLRDNVEQTNTDIFPVVLETQNVRRNIILGERNMLDMAVTDDMEMIKSIQSDSQQRAEEVNASLATMESILKNTGSEEDLSKLEHFREHISELGSIRSSTEKLLLESNGEKWKEAETITRNEYIPISQEIRADLRDFSDHIQQDFKQSTEQTKKASAVPR